MEKLDYFNNLIDSVSFCNLCPRMGNRKKVLSSLNGNINSKIIFIAEAPGRLGAECTGIPLCGDITGNNFETLLLNIGWKREDVFITNAILCNPQDDKGNNSSPTHEEICNCSYYLEMLLELIQPEVIVTLGGRALEALNNIEPHSYELKNSVATLLPWHGFMIFPLYHMSPRASIHRSAIQQRSDFIILSHQVSPQTGLKKKRDSIDVNNHAQEAIHGKTIAMVEYILFKLKQVSFFKLTKLMYLIDYNYLLQYEHTMSNCIYLRMQEGPWIPYLRNIVQESRGIKSLHCDNHPLLAYKYGNFIGLCEEEMKFIDIILSKYENTSDNGIKTIVYLTKPMKYILRQEQLGRNMLKKPVLYKNQTIETLDSQ